MSNCGRLDGKTAIITGAANGIGRATSVLFAREGAKVVLADINEDGLKETAKMVEDVKAASAVYKKTDVSVEDDIKDLVQYAMDCFSRVDVLCNNAGISGFLVNLEDQSYDEWHKVFDINVMGPVFAVKHVVKLMKDHKKGSIINIASVAGIRSGAGGNAYSASKAALINFTQTAACEVGAYNVRVNAICPGLIETEMTKPVFEYARSIGKEEKLGNKCELLRFAAPEEVANAVLFLASDESSYITGHILAVDGGISASLSLPGRKI